MYEIEVSKTRNEIRRHKMMVQKLIGVAMLILSAIVIWFCSQSEPPYNDATIVLFTIPFGLVNLFSKKVIIQ